MKVKKIANKSERIEICENSIPWLTGIIKGGKCIIAL